MISNSYDNIKKIAAILSFIASIVIGFIALFLPPQGIIDASVLWYTAQLLIFTAGLLGVNMTFDSMKKVASTKTDKEKK